EQNHLKDTWFTESLALTAGKISAYEDPETYLDLVKKMAEYSRAVFSAHEQMPYLQPFQFASEHIIFSMDALDFSNDLPKYNNFINHRPNGFPQVSIHIENATKVRISHSTTMVSPILAGASLLLCLISIVLTLARRGTRAQLIRLGFIVTFVMNATNLYFLNKAAVNQVRVFLYV
ncbi:unnamed protein product, partial [Strongylus vulgaris]